MALNGAVLSRLASTFKDEEVEERLHLTAGLHLAFDHSNVGYAALYFATQFGFDGFLNCD